MTEQEVISVTPPKSTKSYKALAHSEVINITKEVCYKQGLVIESERYYGARNGRVIMGYYDIADSRDTEIGTRIMFQNCYDKIEAFKFAMGVRVFICSNGMVRGDLGAYKKRHAGNIQTLTIDTITKYIEGAQDTFTNFIDQKNAMKLIEVSKSTVAKIIGDLYITEDLVKERQLSVIKQQILNPSFDYGCKNSLWELYNHVTYALKDGHPANYIDAHSNVNKYFLNLC